DTNGIKPLYLTHIDGQPHFASEMRTLIQAMPSKPALDMGSISAFLALQYVPGPRTMCVGIESVPAGTIVSWCEGRETHRRFQTRCQAVPPKSAVEFQADFPAVMQRAVEDHMI